MAMTQKAIGNEWTPIVTGSTGDTLVVINSGAARIATGDEPSDDVGFDVSAGYQIVLPAGVDLYAYATGGPAFAVVGPFGV